MLLRKIMLCLLTYLLLYQACYAQYNDSVVTRLTKFPTAFFSGIQGRTEQLSHHLTDQTEKYLAKLARREQRLKMKLYKVDSNAARKLFDGSAERYGFLAQKLRNDTGSGNLPIGGEYQPYVDSLQGSLHFLQQYLTLATSANGFPINGPVGNLSSMSLQVQHTIGQLQTSQAKMQDAETAREYIRQRRQQIGDYISQHANVTGIMGKQFQGSKEDQYYYAQQVRQYKESLNDPGKMELKGMAMLSKLPAFQAFMKDHSQLAGLFNLPANYGSSAGLAGLQTRDQVSALINGQVASGGAGGAAALQANLQSGQSQLSGYKDKLSQLGAGSGDIDMPDFKPNNQKTKPFWKRLEYGTTFQTTRNNYYFPAITDLGVTVGYMVNAASSFGLGASYKLGWGNGIQHIAFSSQGVGLRSFLDIKLKGSFFVSGGFEYNYTTPFRSMQQLHNWADWTRSGLLGIAKTVTVKNRFFNKTKLQLLWDFLSYQQVPKTQPILFRIGYVWR